MLVWRIIAYIITINVVILLDLNINSKTTNFSILFSLLFSCILYPCEWQHKVPHHPAQKPGQLSFASWYSYIPPIIHVVDLISLISLGPITNVLCHHLVPSSLVQVCIPSHLDHCISHLVSLLCLVSLVFKQAYPSK